MTSQEYRLLEKLAEGKFDRQKFKLETIRGTILELEVRSGVPIMYECDPDVRMPVGQFIEIFPGGIINNKNYLTDEEKMEFFKEYGELFWDKDAEEYGASKES